jgi:lysophospholipase L1-like esterase
VWSLLAACCTACGDDPAAHGSAIAGGAGVLGSAGVAAGHGAGGAAGLGAGQAGTAGGAPISAGSGAAGFGAGGASGQIAGGAGGATGTSGGAAGAGAAGVGGAGMAGGQGGAAAGEGGAAGMAGEYAPCPATSEVCFILPLGDSITVGLGYSGGYRVELFRRALADGKSIDFTGSQSNGPTTVEGEPFPSNHEGHSGWKIDQLRSRIPMPALDEEPHIILLMIGTNDVAQNDDLANAPERLASLIDLLAMNAPEALIVVATLTPLSFGSGGVQSYNAAIPDVVEAAAAMGMHVLLVDMFTGFPASELGDGVHPNQQGYERMAGVWYEAIAPMLH